MDGNTLSYASFAEKQADKALLELARAALDIAPSTLCLDDCQLWQLKGSRGRITTWGDGHGYLLSIYDLGSKQAWTWAKKRLRAVGCVVTQDAETEGVFRFNTPLTADAGSVLRDLAGLHKAVALSDEARALLAERIGRSRHG